MFVSVVGGDYSQTRSVKILWFGFIGAGNLIGNQDSPIATSVTTDPIEDLNFPVVTVCPPKDILKAGNGTLSEHQKMILREAANKIFEGKAHSECVKTILAHCSASTSSYL